MRRNDRYQQSKAKMGFEFRIGLKKPDSYLNMMTCWGSCAGGGNNGDNAEDAYINNFKCQLDTTR
jgi:hypothetical protein